MLDYLKKLVGDFVTSFAYDAVLPKGKRKAPSGLLRSEDLELMSEDRRKLVSTSRDLARNFTIAGWMIRRHIDYVTTFHFQAKTASEALNKKTKAFIAERAKAKNCDISGRHSLSQMLRIGEARRMIDHDVFFMRLAVGALQAIEGDRIRTPLGTADGTWIPTPVPGGMIMTAWVQGVQIDIGGRPLNYAVFSRGNSANLFILDRFVDAANIYHHAHFERFDQVRGVSPLAAALNTLRDAYESADYALAKMKVAQLFGLSIYRDTVDTLGQTSAQSTDYDESDDGDTGFNSNGTTSAGYKVDFSQGPFLLDMDPGDKAEFLEAKSPSTEFQAFWQAMIAAALKAADIPYCFYAENYTNYGGTRLAFLQYEAGAAVKRDKTHDFLDWWTAWQLQLGLDSGYFTAEEFALLMASEAWRWVHRGMPWLDPYKEVQADLRAIDAGLDNEEDVALRHGKDAYENVDKRARFLAYAKRKGVPLNAMNPLPATPLPGDGRQQPGDAGDGGSDEQDDPADDQAGPNSGDQIEAGPADGPRALAGAAR